MERREHVRRGTLLALALVLLLLQLVIAAPITCEFKASCTGNETVVLRAENYTGGYMNAHAQVENSTASNYAYALCCDSDANHQLNGSCDASGAVTILRSWNHSNSHIQIPVINTYAYPICLSTDYGSLDCEYVNSTCSASYHPLLSMASSNDVAPYNMSNAHVGNYSDYVLNLCCSLGNAAPILSYVTINSTYGTNKSDENLTAYPISPFDADGDDISYAWDWRVNGTSIAVVNMNFDVNNSGGAGKTRDYTTHNNTMTVNTGAEQPFWNATGGWNATGAYFFDGVNDSIEVSSVLIQNASNFTYALWVKVDATQPDSEGVIITQRVAGSNNCYYLRYLPASNALQFVTKDTVILNSYTMTEEWTHVAVAVTPTTVDWYVNGMHQETDSGDIWCVQTPSALFRLGRSVYSGHAYDFKGSLDNVLVFNRTLSAQEIALLGTNRTNVLASPETAATDEWAACITPNDGTVDGATYCSVNLTVERSTPTTPVLVYPVQNNQSVFERNVTLDWYNSTDGDGDTITYNLSLNVTPGGCAVEHAETGLSPSNFTTDELCVDQQYNWSVQACDVDGCSAWASLWNFTVESTLGIRFRQNETDFGTLLQNANANTIDGPAVALAIENDGNIKEDITFRALSAIFTSVALNTSSFQYSVAANESGSFITGSSQTTLENVSNVYRNAFINLSYIDEHDDGLIHLNVTVPDNEPPGAKNTTVMVSASAS